MAANDSKPLPPFTSKQLAYFHSRVSIGEPEHCWPWKGKPNSHGYGTIKIRPRLLTAHRVAYFFASGVDPAPLHVLHKCDNRICCNPNHLFLGRELDNNRDAAAKGRTASGDRNSQRLYPERRAYGDKNGTHVYPERVARGEKCGASKLTADKVRLIRKLYAEGDISYFALADRFGVTFSCIGRVVTGATWSHVDLLKQ